MIFCQFAGKQRTKVKGCGVDRTWNEDPKQLSPLNVKLTFVLCCSACSKQSSALMTAVSMDGCVQPNHARFTVPCSRLRLCSRSTGLRGRGCVHAELGWPGRDGERRLHRRRGPGRRSKGGNPPRHSGGNGEIFIYFSSSLLYRTSSRSDWMLLFFLLGPPRRWDLRGCAVQ